MKKTFLLTALLCASISSAFALDLVLDDFNSYTVGDSGTASNSDLAYYAFGDDVTEASTLIAGDGIDNYLSIAFDSGVGVPPYVPLGVTQTDDLTPFSLVGGSVSFDIRTTGLTSAVNQVISAQIVARTYDPNDMSDLGYKSWRLQNYSGQVYGNTTAEILKTFQNTTWDTLTFNASDFIFNSTDERHWNMVDLTDVIAVEILFLQVPIDAQGTLNDWVQAGTVDIDNITIHNAVVPEPGAMLLCAFGGIFVWLRKKLVK